MTPFPMPEILRTPLESLVVQAKIHSPDCKVFKEQWHHLCIYFYWGGFPAVIECHIFILCVCVKAVDFLSQVLDSPEQEAVRDAVRNLQDIGE